MLIHPCFPIIIIKIDLLPSILILYLGSLIAYSLAFLKL
jgi:hypothetical protein